MKKLYTLLFLSFSTFLATAQNLPFVKMHTYHTGVFNDGGTEIIAFDKNSQRLFSINHHDNTLDIIDYSDITKPYKISSIDLSIYLARANSVAVSFGLVAVVGEGTTPQLPGKLLFFDQDGVYLSQFTIGPVPRMVTFTNGGNKVLIACEGAPSDDYQSDPYGLVNIIDISFGFPTTTQSYMKTVDFERLDTVAYDPLVRIFGNNGSEPPSRDIEPEYVTVNANDTKAYVSLQENNAIAIIDINSATLDTVVGLGYKDFSTSGLDASDMAGSININTYSHLFGMYQPNALAAYENNGNTYIYSANEGASRHYSGYSEEVRVHNLPVSISTFPNFSTLLNDSVLGRLKVTNTLGDGNNDNIYDSLFCFGGRSFSIWDENAQLLWDSGDDFEQTLKQLFAANFNSDYDDNSSRKSRSDDMGPQPNALAIGTVDSNTYVFITLERMGGIMIYDITNPTNPQFVMYDLNRDFSKPASNANAGDLGPQKLVFVPATQSPSGYPLLYVSNKISGTITLYQLGLNVGLPEDDVKKSNFFPNPSSGIFESARKADYSVYDINGKLITTVKNKNRLDLSHQAAGFYIIKDGAGNAVRVVKK